MKLRIREMRKAKNVSQKELAAILKTTTATISRYEAEKQSISLERLVAIANALEVPVTALFTEEGSYAHAD